MGATLTQSTDLQPTVLEMRRPWEPVPLGRDPGEAEHETRTEVERRGNTEDVCQRRPRIPEGMSVGARAVPESVAPESYTLDTALMERPGNKEIQLDLFLNYASNVKLYPKFQEYFRKAKPPLLAIWGKNDPFFLPAGAEAEAGVGIMRDLPIPVGAADDIAVGIVRDDLGIPDVGDLVRHIDCDLPAAGRARCTRAG